MGLKKISDKDLTKEEMLLFLNETSISIAIESDDELIAANRFFYELTGFDSKKRKNPVSSIYAAESAVKIEECKKRILETVEKSQTIRAEDKQFQVFVVNSSGKEIKCIIDIVLLSTKPVIKWGYKLIDRSNLHLEQSRTEKMEKLKDSLLNLSQSLVRIKDIQNFYDLVLEAAAETITNGEFCTILRIDEVQENFIPVAAKGYSWELMENFKLPIKESFAWLKLGHLLDKTLIIDDIQELYKRSKKLIEIEGHELKSSMQTPIYVDNELYGILTIDSSSKSTFTESDFNIIEYLRTQIQIALENQLLYNRIQHKASHDELTDVISRGPFEEQVIKFLSTKHHYESCCIVMMDLNDLKVVNDIWGHSAGDSYLIEFISVMKQHMRGSDLLSRLGGDEFAICFFSSQSAQFIERLEEIQKHFIDNPLELGGRKVSCWFSYGISHCPEDGETYDVLINTADSQMYKMKADLKSKILKNDLHDYR
ncbi:MAG TPA: hypothetical protein DCO79_13180 [Spirochaeta sp.]|nr:hypothetical protein [Spirochaeta sp.]